MLFMHKITGELFELGLYNPEIRDTKDTLLLIDQDGTYCLFLKINFDFIGWL